jgi:hypothetical protein
MVSRSKVALGRVVAVNLLTRSRGVAIGTSAWAEGELGVGLAVGANKISTKRKSTTRLMSAVNMDT